MTNLNCGESSYGNLYLTKCYRIRFLDVLHIDYLVILIGLLSFGAVHIGYYFLNFDIPLKEKRREEIEKKLEQKAEEERKEVFTQKKELFQTRREKQQELRTLERKMDNALLVSYFVDRIVFSQ